MAHNPTQALMLVKARLNRLPGDTSLDEYLALRIKATDDEFARTGIRLRAESADDMMLLADYVVEGHLNRDKGGQMPEWLRLKRRERWLKEGAIT